MDLKTTGDIDLLDIMGLLKPGKPLFGYRNNIEGIFQIGRDVYNLTFRDTSQMTAIKNEFREQFSQGIATPKGKIFPEMPKTPAMRINIRAIPVEIPDKTVVETLQKFGPGTVKHVQRVYHKGTNILNGYRTVTIEDYVPQKLPQFVRFEGANCKIFFPADEFAAIKTCRKCLTRGHDAGPRMQGHHQKFSGRGRGQGNII